MVIGNAIKLHAMFFALLFTITSDASLMTSMMMLITFWVIVYLPDTI
jgi:hypothetical protein